MTLPGKFDEYLALKKDGLNTIELDLKDESGNVALREGRAGDRAKRRRRARVLQPDSGRRAGPRAPAST